MTRAAATLRLLGDDTRLRLLRVLAREALNVSELTAILGLAQSGVSRHLGLLRDAASNARGPMFAGGKSMGGRIASQVAALKGFTPAPAGLVFFGYPLHPPGKPEQRRDRHLPNVAAPMLFLSGTRDPFGSPEEFRELTATLSDATLELVDGGDHSLVVAKSRDRMGEALEHAMDTAARWITSLTSKTRGA